MNEIKTLADQLRTRMAKPDTPATVVKPAKKSVNAPEIPPILEQLRAMEVSNNKTLIHARIDGQTAQVIHHLKIATGVEVSRLICFSIKQLFDQHPDLKKLVKEHLENFQL